MVYGMDNDYIKNGKLIIEENGVSRVMTDEESINFLKLKLWLTGRCTINETTVRFESGDE